MKPQHEIKRAEERLERIKDVIGAVALCVIVYAACMVVGGLMP